MENASKALIIAGAILISILLISIGIILINSGRDVGQQGSQQMASQKIQTFNAQFTGYEGTKNGASLKGLRSLVTASNSTDEAHQVSVVLVATGATTLSGLSSSRNYNVELNYAASDATQNLTSGGTVAVGPDAPSSEAGYVYEIVISGNVIEREE